MSETFTASVKRSGDGWSGFPFPFSPFYALATSSAVMRYPPSKERGRRRKGTYWRVVLRERKEKEGEQEKRDEGRARMRDGILRGYIQYCTATCFPEKGGGGRK